MAIVLYTPQEVADLLKLRVETVYEYIRTGRLSAARLGNRYRISQTDLDTFLEKARTTEREG